MFNNKSNTICIIPARENSTRVKNKNLLKIKNKTLIEICIKQAKSSKIFKDIILSSDSNKILKVGKNNQINCFKRKKNLSRSTTLTDEVIADLIPKINYKFKNIVILQVTSPNRNKKTIIKFLEYCLKNKLSKCLTVSIINENISKYGRYFLPLAKNKRRSQDRKPYLYENGLMYFLSKSSFIKDKKISSQNKWDFFVTNRYESIDINIFEDYIASKKLFGYNWK